jgi:phage terminase large subunit-like protein
MRYQNWAADGWLTTTDGNVVDYDVIERDILAINEVMPIKRLGFDRYRSFAIIAHLVEALGDNVVVPVSQTFAGMNAPMMQIERLIMSAQLQHGDNPITNWMLGNVSIMISSNEEIKLDRKNKKGKIDGIAAMVDAFNVWMNDEFTVEQLNILDLIYKNKKQE